MANQTPSRTMTAPFITAPKPTPNPPPEVAKAIVAKLAAEMPPVGPPALEELPPRPEEDPGIIGEALAIVRRNGKFQLIGVKIAPDMPHRIIREVPSDSGIVASGIMVQEIKRRMMRIGLLKAARIEDMKNIVTLPEEKTA